MAAKLEMLNVCPQLVPQDRTGRCYDGFITVSNRSYRIAIEIPQNGSLKDARIDCSWKLRHLLRGCESVIKQRLSQSADLASFMIELQSLMERLLQCKPKDDNQVMSQPHYYTELINELETISLEKLAYVDPSFKVLKLLARDGKDREHILTVLLSQQHPLVAPSCTTDLPEKFSFSWRSHNFPLQSLYQQFQQAVANFQEFWDEMDEIDGNTWVLEPDHPNRASTTRRIAHGKILRDKLCLMKNEQQSKNFYEKGSSEHGNNSSIQISINPSHPRLLPECRFLGADNVIIPLREKLNSNASNWDPNTSVLSNLEHILELKFPSPSTSKKEDFSMECGICYSYRLNDMIPDKACDDPRCGQPFHRECLFEWLKSLPSCRQSFNMVFGECPYCSKPITVKMS